MDFRRSVSPASNDHEDSCDSDDRQEMESYLYSLVHHEFPPEKEISQVAVQENKPPEGGDVPAEPKNLAPNKRFRQRYFNATSREKMKEYLSLKIAKRTKRILNPFCWKPTSETPFPSKFNKFVQPNLSRVRTNNNESNKPKDNNVDSVISKESLSTDNDTVHLDNEKNACFELPTIATAGPRTRSKSRQNLNDSMTQVLGTMLEEDASRSSVDSERRQETNQRLKECAKPNSGPGWTVAMSWEDMSSKFRFNFEDESVCGESTREGSTPAGSRANTPEPPPPGTSHDDVPKPVASPEPSPAGTCDDHVSKYVVSLKSKGNSSYVLIDDADSDSDGESVVEMSPPVKEPPPVVEIESDGEVEVLAKRRKLTADAKQDTDVEEDIVIVFEKGNEQSSTSTTSRRTSECQGTRIQTPPLATEQRVGANEAQNPRSSAYDFDLERILSEMSTDPELWRLCREDIIPKAKIPWRNRFPPCDNCKQRDHLTHRCPEPPKIRVCFMCGAPGHSHTRCPEGMCLMCGRRPRNSRMGFSKTCIPCGRNVEFCTICSLNGHNSKRCPDLWRRYHWTTTAGPPVTPVENDVRPAKDMWCCNCAKKGHYSHDCSQPFRFSTKLHSQVVSYADPRETSTARIAAQPAPPVSTNATGDKCSVSENLHVASTSSCLQQESPQVPNASEHTESTCESQRLEENMKKVSACSASYTLPRKRDSLVTFLTRELARLDNPPMVKSKAVMTCYHRYLEHLKCDSVKARAKAIACARLLNITFQNHFRFAEGKMHAAKLKEVLQVMKDAFSGKRVSKGLRRVVNKHYNALFRSVRKDLGYLVQIYCKRMSSKNVVFV